MWTFEPLRDKRQPPRYLRDDREGSDARLLRRPYGEQKTRLITLGVGLLLVGGDGEEKFLRFQRAHKIEISDDNGKTFVEYVPDLSSQAELTVLNNIDELVSCEIKFVEAQTRFFHEWYPR